VTAVVAAGSLVVGCAAVASRPPGIRAMGWNEVQVPALACWASKPIRLHDGAAVARTARWSAYLPDHQVTVYREDHVAYGDLDGDGLDEAALGIVCTNGGGTAGGQLAVAQVIFRLVSGSLHAVGIVRPRVRAGVAYHVPLVSVQILLRRVVATEYFYGPRDGDCCASGLARTIWRYVNGSLLPGPTVVTRPAAK
jgi:hypothetical protein